MEWLSFLHDTSILPLLAAVCSGAIIGLERERRQKTADLRTHVIVCLSAALMMLVSKHGFYDVLSDHISLDPSRIAASVVTAIGFLGAGVIFVHKQAVVGLNTAAGIWATVVVGMAQGAGMYFPGFLVTALVLLIQLLTHRTVTLARAPMTEKIVVRLTGSSTPTSFLKMLEDQQIQVKSTVLRRLEDGALELKLYVRFPEGYALPRALEMLQKDPRIQSIEL